jgi:hypothetical protein
MISYEPKQQAEDVVYAAAFVLNMPVLMTGETLVTVPAGMDAVTLAPHVTLAYKPSQLFLDSLTIGEEFEVNVLKILADERAIVAHVSLPEGVPFQNEYPHLTIALGYDVKAVYSNELLGKFYQDDKSVDELDMSNIDGLKVGISPGSIPVKVGTWRRQPMPVAEPVTMAIAHE